MVGTTKRLGGTSEIPKIIYHCFLPYSYVTWKLCGGLIKKCVGERRWDNQLLAIFQSWSRTSCVYGR
jgi:hypothetical protein